MITNTYILKLNRGDKLVSKLSDFITKNDIKYGWISGIGAFSSAVLSVYDLEKREYSKKEFEGKFELISLTGNIGLLNNEPAFHMHVSLGTENFKVIGGHLDDAVVSVTCEIFIQSIDNKIVREFDSDIGLNLIKPAE